MMKDSKVKVDWLAVFVWLLFLPCMSVLSIYAIGRLIKYLLGLL